MGNQKKKKKTIIYSSGKNFKIYWCGGGGVWLCEKTTKQMYMNLYNKFSIQKKIEKKKLISAIRPPPTNEMKYLWTKIA